MKENIILYELYETKPKIIDCFIFYNELKMLEFRLKELYNDIDYFILVESTKTFTNKDKILYYEENKNMFKKYSDKIIHIIIEDSPNDINPWNVESFQRNCIDRGINKLSLYDNDLIIISDVDEIPNMKTIKKIIEKKNKNKIIKRKNKNDPSEINNLYYLEQSFYYYNLNTKLEEIWQKSKILNYKTYLKYNCNPNDIRSIKNKNAIKNGGWHFSYFGDIKFIMNKINNFSHQEYNNNNYNNKNIIEQKIKNKESLFNDTKFEYIKIEDNKNLPENYLLLNFDS
jgi:beta-1,4-mannosyl-glycoprotein beta-1,4-N-acetylglucosaminyltransferase